MLCFRVLDHLFSQLLFLFYLFFALKDVRRVLRVVVRFVLFDPICSLLCKSFCGGSMFWIHAGLDVKLNFKHVFIIPTVRVLRMQHFVAPPVLLFWVCRNGCFILLLLFFFLLLRISVIFFRYVHRHARLTTTTTTGTTSINTSLREMVRSRQDYTQYIRCARERS